MCVCLHVYFLQKKTKAWQITDKIGTGYELQVTQDLSMRTQVTSYSYLTQLRYLIEDSYYNILYFYLQTFKLNKCNYN